jgi:predicted amidohydrolase
MERHLKLKLPTEQKEIPVNGACRLAPGLVSSHAQCQHEAGQKNKGGRAQMRSGGVYPRLNGENTIF